jgi:hypothetical protein
MTTTERGRVSCQAETTGRGGKAVASPARGKLAARFQFDHVFDPTSDNTTIFQQVLQPGVSKCLEGYNFTVFAYGQVTMDPTPQAARGWAHPPCRHFKNLSC